MFLNLGMVLNSILLVAGLFWCKEVFERWQDDVAELKQSEDRVKKGVIVFIWLLTLVILLFIVTVVSGIAANIVKVFL